MTSCRGMCRTTLLSLLLTPALSAWGLININFTPVQLVKDSEVILLARVKSKEIGSRIELQLVKAIKGSAPAVMLVDFSTAAEAQATAAKEHFKALGEKPLALFINDAVSSMRVHADGAWMKIVGTNGKWRLDIVDPSMQGTWAGGTDMLMRCIEYVIAAGNDAKVPAVEGTTWRAVRKVASVGGEARDMMAVDLAGNGKLCLFIASEKGDRLLKPSKDAFEDITDKVKLASKSRLAAWGDFDGDGLMDLASWDGKSLTIWSQSADGTFTASKPGGNFTLPAECVGLATIGVAGSSTPGLLVSPAFGAPILLKPAGKNAFEAVTLPATAEMPKEYGKAQACIVADFNDDSLIDIIQPFEKGGLIYVGNADGTFALSKPCGVCCTAGGGKAATGDFDGDGLPDVLVAGAEGVRIFQNLGNGAFEEALALSGELGYKRQPLASWCAVGDFNNDSRPDLLITFGGQPALLYFNRGFRSFGESPKLEEALKAAPDLQKGQRMGMLADLFGSGAQDLLLATNSGDVWCALNNLGEEGMCIKARLSGKSPTAGPVNVSLFSGKRCMGTATVVAGGAPAFFGIEKAGKYTMKWRFPGGQKMSKAVEIDDKPATVVLDAVK